MTGVLDSLKVLDFSVLLPGPYATMMLADMGADVLRVESPDRLDMVRLLPPMVNRTTSAGQAYLNRGKRSLALNLKADKAREIVYRLVADYDIVIEQFRPGVMDKLGVGYETLKAVNPRLIYCAITGYGQSGPYRDRAGHDLNYLAVSGVASYSRRQGERPCPQGIQVADVAGGAHHAVMSLLAAVIHRQNTGEGQFIDISMTDAAFAMNALSGAGFLASGHVPEPEGEVLNGGMFYDYYETSDGRYFSVAGLEPQFVQGLCDALGIPEMAKVALSQKPSDQWAFKKRIAEVFKQKDFSHWCEWFRARDLCVEPVLNLEEATHHEQLREREVVVDVPLAESPESVRQPAFPVRFSSFRAQPRHAGGRLGAHTEEVLEALNYTKDDIASLKAAGVFGSWRPG